ncbi:MAG TPA: lipid-A-disaccharide synthase [Sediminibacterium sp.]|nr:lipid-A-disaccharide synthase [Sediminibacterium sp.]
MKYYLIAGEASGDLHGSRLVQQIRQTDPAASLRGWGGDLMQNAGLSLVKHFRDLAFMGFAEVAANLPTILRNIRFCKQDILAFQPEVLVLIDYPGFNLRIARWAKEQGFKVVYYISPQVWAWKSGRVRSMKKCIDRLLCILPFEKAYYRKQWQWDVDYVGHPLTEVIADKQLHPPAALQYTRAVPTTDQRIIALLPGSRRQEIRKKLPIMLSVASAFPAYRFVVAQAPALEDDFYAPFLEPYPNVAAVRNQTYDLLQQASAALVTSGTATLETALFGVPEVVCYKGSEISYQIAKRLIDIDYISLVNLIMNRPVVKELIQGALTRENLVEELTKLLDYSSYRAAMLQDYRELKNLLSNDGQASARAAAIICEVAGTSMKQG